MKTNSTDSDFGLDEVELKQNLIEARNTIVRNQLAPVTLGLAILYVLITFYYFFSLTGRPHLIISWIAAITTIVLFFLAYYTKKRTIPLKSVHPIALSIAVLLLIDATIYLALTGEAYQMNLILLTVIGCGFFLLSTRMVVVFIFLCIGCYLAVAWNKLNSPTWIQHGFSLMIASCMALLVHIVRLRTIERTERLRLQNEYQNKKLKQALADLEKQEYLYKDLFENANDFIQSVDHDGRFIYVNKRWKEVLGYTDEDLVNLRLDQIIAPDHAEECKVLFQRVTKGETIYNLETVFISKDGRRITVEGNVNGQLQDGRFIATRGIFRDITIRRLALQEVEKMRDVLKDLNQQLAAAYQESRQQQDELLKLLHEEQSAFLLDSNGKILGVTEKAIQITGFSRLDMVGKNIKDLIESDTRLKIDDILKLGIIGGFKRIDTGFIQPDGNLKKLGLGLNRLNMEKEKLFVAIIWEK